MKYFNELTNWLNMTSLDLVLLGASKAVLLSPKNPRLLVFPSLVVLILLLFKDTVEMERDGIRGS